MALSHGILAAHWHFGSCRLLTCEIQGLRCTYYELKNSNHCW